MTQPPPPANGRTSRTYTTDRFQLVLPEFQDRVDIRVLNAAFEKLNTNAAHLGLDNTFTGRLTVNGGPTSISAAQTVNVGMLYSLGDVYAMSGEIFFSDARNERYIQSLAAQMRYVGRSAAPPGTVHVFEQGPPNAGPAQISTGHIRLGSSPQGQIGTATDRLGLFQSSQLMLGTNTYLTMRPDQASGTNFAKFINNQLGTLLEVYRNGIGVYAAPTNSATAWNDFIWFGHADCNFYNAAGTYLVQMDRLNVRGGIASTAAGGTYAFEAPNIANASGMGRANAWQTYSSLAFKRNVRPLTDPLALVKDDALHGIEYDQNVLNEQVHRIGFVADAWLDKVPEIVGTDASGNVESMDYSRVGAITFEALKLYIQQTDARIGALEAALHAATTTNGRKEATHA